MERVVSEDVPRLRIGPLPDEQLHHIRGVIDHGAVEGREVEVAPVPDIAALRNEIPRQVPSGVGPGPEQRRQSGLVLRIEKRRILREKRLHPGQVSVRRGPVDLGGLEGPRPPG